MKRSKPKVGFSPAEVIHQCDAAYFSPPVSSSVSAVCRLIPAKALEIRSFFHSQGWSYSSGGRSSSCGRRLSRGQRERSGSGSPPFSAGSYGVSYRGSCLTDPSFAPLPVPPDRISMGKKKKEREKLVITASHFVCVCTFTQTRNRTKKESSPFPPFLPLHPPLTPLPRFA